MSGGVVGTWQSECLCMQEGLRGSRLVERPGGEQDVLSSLHG